MNRTTIYSRTLLCLLSAAIISPPLLVSFSHQAEARAGRGFSMGSRGSRTYRAPSYTRTAPTGGQSFQRTMTRPPASSGFNSTPNNRSVPPASPVRPTEPINGTAPSQKGNFLKGVAGGVAGAAAYNMLMGNHRSNAQTPSENGNPGPNQAIDQNQNVNNGVPNQSGTLPPSSQPQKKSNSSNSILWIIILGGLVWFGIRYFRKNTSTNNQQNNNPSTNPIKEYIKESNIQLDQNDYTSFQQRLVEVQEAWSRQDLSSLQKITTPEMLAYFNEQLTDLSSKGLHNTVSNVQFQQGDLSEAWTEGTREYATVAMRYSLIDVTTDNTGRVVEGNPDQPTNVTELWTFVRSVDHKWWLLSGIQQQN